MTTQPAQPTRPRGRRQLIPLLPAVLLFFFSLTALAKTPNVGAKAPDFTLATPAGVAVHLSTVRDHKPLVLVFLRGYPGYQCPYCQRQVHDFVEHAAAFASRNATVLLVYPGPPADLGQRAGEFLASEPQLPPNIILVTDPEYKVTNIYGLRWNSPGETAYPSTFILNGSGKVIFEKISREHGDRLSAGDALSHLQ